MRASDTDRSKVTNFLSDSLQKGFITTEELGQRVETALVSRTFSDLLGIVNDIPGGKELIKDSATGHVRSSYRTEQRLPSISLPTGPTYKLGHHRPRRNHRVLRTVLLMAAMWFVTVSAVAILKLMLGPIMVLLFPVILIGIVVVSIRFMASPRRFRR